VKDDFEDQVQDTEITLGTGKLLGIFFAVVIVCAVFFTMGYLLGKSTATGGRTEIVGNTPMAAGSTAGKPSAVAKVPEAPAPTPSADSQASSTASNPASSPAVSNAAAANPSSPAPTSAPTEIKASPNGTFMVQVAAVSKQEDADILKSALQKKQYPVFVANSTSDALYHVQVGPFSNQQDADTMRNRLSADGYNAIVKH
jgi:cell division septation protein DedD